MRQRAIQSHAEAEKRGDGAEAARYRDVVTDLTERLDVLRGGTVTGTEAGFDPDPALVQRLHEVSEEAQREALSAPDPDTVRRYAEFVERARAKTGK
jgi:hypothetical protein